MKIGILCFRSYDGYSGESELALQETAVALGYEAELVLVSELSFSPDGEILMSGEHFPAFDVLISRARVIDQVENRLFVLKLLEEKGFTILNRYEALRLSKNKWFTTEALRKASVTTIPTWVASDEAVVLKIADELGYPVVVKAAYGTYGLGVAKAEAPAELREVLARFWKEDFIQPILLQPFIAEADSKDHRVFVVGGRVVASRERTAHGDFRANMELGATAEAVSISEEEMNLALAAVQAIGLDYAGVDIIRTKKGPAVLEVNGNTGFRTLDEASGKEVLEAIIELAAQRANESSRSRQ